MRAKRVTVTFLLDASDYEISGWEGKLLAQLTNTKYSTILYLDVKVNRIDDVEVNDLRNLEVDWDDWFDTSQEENK